MKIPKTMIIDDWEIITCMETKLRGSIQNELILH